MIATLLALSLDIAAGLRTFYARREHRPAWDARSTTALLAAITTADQWNVFVLRDGRARLQRVNTDQMSDTEVEITAGLHANDTIRVHPSDQIHDGVRVSARR